MVIPLHKRFLLFERILRCSHWKSRIHCKCSHTIHIQNHTTLIWVLLGRRLHHTGSFRELETYDTQFQVESEVVEKVKEDEEVEKVVVKREVATEEEETTEEARHDTHRSTWSFLYRPFQDPRTIYP